jgi:hypothetical protein
MKFSPNSVRKLAVMGQVGVPVGVLVLALDLRVSAGDTLLGTVLGAYLAYVIQQRTESKIHKAQFHTDLIEQVLAPLYTQVYTRKEEFRRMNEEGEQVPLDTSTIRSVSSNWLYSRLGEPLLRSIDEYTRSMKAVDQMIEKARQSAYNLAGRAASENFQEPKNITTVFCSRGPGAFRSVTVDLMIGRNPFSGMKEGSLVLGDGNVTNTVQFVTNKALFEQFWKAAEDLASKDPDIVAVRELLSEARRRTLELDRQLDQEIEQLRV